MGTNIASDAVRKTVRKQAPKIQEAIKKYGPAIKDAAIAAAPHMAATAVIGLAAKKANKIIVTRGMSSPAGKAKRAVEEVKARLKASGQRLTWSQEKALYNQHKKWYTQHPNEEAP